MPRGIFLDCCCQCPCPCGEPLSTHTSRWDPPTLAGSFGSVSCGVTCWVTVSCEVTAPWLLLVCASALQDWCLCFPQSCRSPVVKSHWPSRSDSLGIPSPFVGSPGWEAWYGVQNLHNSGRTSLVLLFSSLWVTHPGVWNLILSWLHPSYHLTATSSLSLDIEYLFLVSSSILLSMVVQQWVAILALSQEMSTCPSTLPSWTRSRKFDIAL